MKNLTIDEKSTLDTFNIKYFKKGAKLMNILSNCLMIAFIISVASLNAVARERVDSVVAVVNDKIITQTEYEEEARLHGVNIASPENKTDFLEQIIHRTIIEQEAKKAGIAVTDAEVEQKIKELQSHYNMNKEEMEKKIKEQNMTEAGMRKQWKFQIITEKLIQRKIKGNITVTDEEVRDYYKQVYGKLEEGSVNETEIAHILILQDSPDAKQKALQITTEAKNGGNFAQMAKQYSQDAMSAPNGGVLGYFKRRLSGIT